MAKRGATSWCEQDERAASLPKAAGSLRPETACASRHRAAAATAARRSKSGGSDLSVRRIDIHHRGTEDTEITQRLELFSVCYLRVLCASVVSAVFIFIPVRMRA